MELTANQILDYIHWEETKHRTTRESLLRKGATYRSRTVTLETGYLNALRDIRDAIELPAKNEALSQAMKKFGSMLKG